MGGGEDRNRGGLEKRSGEAGEEAGRSGRNWTELVRAQQNFVGQSVKKGQFKKSTFSFRQPKSDVELERQIRRYECA